MILFSRIDFEQLHMDDKLIHLANYGTYIASRYSQGMEVALYSYNNFFAELWKNKHNYNTYWITVSGPEIADKYVRDTDFKSLFPVS